MLLPVKVADIFRPPGRNVTDSCFHNVGHPLDRIAALVLDVKHLFVHLLHGHAASEHDGHSQIAAMAEAIGGHHILGV